jgi:hypothetical protein
MAQVTIGRDFFKKAKNDYNDFEWAFVREFNQNGIDCRSTRIYWNIELTPNGNTKVTIQNDGEVMSEDILRNKLLSLGSSGKSFGESTGGFGKAKEILYFCHLSYSIETGDLVVAGEGGNYELVKHTGPFAAEKTVNGTNSSVILEGNVVLKIQTALQRFAAHTQWTGELYLQVEDDVTKHLVTRRVKGTYRTSLIYSDNEPYAKVYSTLNYPGTAVIRVNGTPMFVCNHTANRGIIVEITKNSNEVLTSNRDGLVGLKRRDLDDFLLSLSVNRRKVLGPPKIKQEVFDGSVFSIDKIAENQQSDSLTPSSPRGSVSSYKTEETLVTENEVLRPNYLKQWHNNHFHEQSCPRVTLLNEMENRSIPDKYRPDSPLFCSYAKRLLKNWNNCLERLYQLYCHDISAEKGFTTGFVFSSSAEALYVSNGIDLIPEGESYDWKGELPIYYINPVRVRRNYPLKQSFRVKDNWRLLTIAAHEFVHGLGYQYHCEDYANQLTELMAKVVRDKNKFKNCF